MTACTPAASTASMWASSISVPGLHDHLAGGRVVDVVDRRAAEDARSDGGHDLAGIDDRLHRQAVRRSAVVDGDDAVLRHVDEAARQIAGIGRLQRRVGEALARAVGGVEVLQDREAFLEVRDDRALDDLARRLGHQPAHARQLLHLGGRSARPRMRHHVDRVDLLLPPRIRVELHRLDALHHLVGDAVGALGPGVDDLVVLLALGDQAVIVLLLVFARERARLRHQPRLGVGDDHVVLAERDARLEAAWVKPSCMIRSQKMTVSFCPVWR